YRLVNNRLLCVKVNMPHGHPQGWAPKEIGLFADLHLGGGKEFPSFVGEMQYLSRGLRFLGAIKYQAPVELEKAEVHWTTDTKSPWQQRKWTTKRAATHTDVIRGELPRIRPLVFFMTMTDKRGVTVSTEHQELRKEE